MKLMQKIDSYVSQIFPKTTNLEKEIEKRAYLKEKLRMAEENGKEKAKEETKEQKRKTKKKAGSWRDKLKVLADDIEKQAKEQRKSMIKI